MAQPGGTRHVPYLPYLIRIGLVATACYAAARAGFALGHPEGIVAPVWPATAVALAAGVALAAAVRERDRARCQLEEANSDLEARVAERTGALAQDRERLAEAQRIAHLGSWEWDVPTDVVTWSAELYRILGVDPGGFDGGYKRYLASVHPEDRGVVEGAVQEACTAGGSFAFEHRVLHPDGQVRWVRSRGAVQRGDDGRAVRMWGTVQDVTDRRRAEAQFRELLEAAPDAMVIVAGDGRITLVNRQAEALFGWSRDELIGEPVEVLLPERFRDVHVAHRAAYRDDPVLRPMGAGFDLFARRADGAEFPVEVSLSPITTDEGTVVLAAVRDITGRRRAEAELAYQAMHDALTGLPNRVLLDDRLGQALARSARVGSGVAVLFVDLDRFKLVNDSRGHAAGDALLATVAERLRQVVRTHDTVARFGGDEFVVVCEDPAAGWEAGLVAERIADVIKEPFAVEGQEVFLSASVGVAVAADGDTAESLLRDADAAMYRAKEEGRSRCEFFDENMRTAAAVRLDTESALHRAVERGELAVFYQPVVDLGSGSLAGVEALVRWRHPQLGLVSPADFIPLAEETGLIVPIGEWILEEAAAQWARWQEDLGERAPPGLNVNLSARQLRQPDLAGAVGKVLSRYGLPPHRLCLELTESSFMEDLEFHGNALSVLRDLGVQLAIDDFGTGFSSLSYLKRFPLHVLKIDRSFVAGLGRDPSDAAIVEGVIDLAHALGLCVVAEGVESPRQVAALAALGCDLAQGYFFAAPGPPASFEELVRAGALRWPARRSGHFEVVRSPTG